MMRRTIPTAGWLVLLAGGVFADAQMPLVLMDTAYITPPGSTTHVASGGNLQTAINNAACGDEITLEAGATFTGNFTLPDKDCSDSTWVVITTDSGSLPAEGTRVGPSDASAMAKLTANSGVIITSDSDADHYRFIGIEFVPGYAGMSGGMISLTGGQGTANQTNHIIFDRCYIHGTTTWNLQRGISAQGAYIAVIDSYLSDIHWLGVEAQAFAAWNGSGPFKLVNNYIEAAGENVLFGGAGATSADYIPSDIEFRRNHCYKPPSWYSLHPSYAGIAWSVKNIFEIKDGQRAWIENNLFEHNWVMAQNGIAILFTVRNEGGGGGGAPWSVVQDVTFRGNIVRSAGGGFNLLGSDDLFTSEDAAHFVIENNLIQDISSTWGGNRLMFSMLRGPDDVRIEHNTGLTGNAIMYAEGSPAGTDHTHRYNIWQHGSGGYNGNSASCINPSGGVLVNGIYYTSPVVTDNIIQGAAAAGCGSAYAGNTKVVNQSDIGFENLGGGDLRLDSASAYYGTAPGGADPGVWFPTAIAAETQLDWSISVVAGDLEADVTFGVPGLPVDQACTLRCGTNTVASTTGANSRTETCTGLVEDQEYWIGVDCGNTWGGAQLYDLFTAEDQDIPGSRTITYAVKPPAILSTVARVKLECADDVGMTDAVDNDASNVACTSAAECTMSLAGLISGTNYCRHTYQTSGDVTVAVSKVQAVVME